MTLPLEQQVCSLEPAKKLRELGVEQQSLFFISERDGRIISNEEYYDFLDFAANVGGGSVEQFYSAFTVAELGDMLPNYCHSWRFVVISNTHSTEWRCENRNCIPPDEPLHVDADTEADARAKCLIYLIENDLIKL